GDSRARRPADHRRRAGGHRRRRPPRDPGRLGGGHRRRGERPGRAGRPATGRRRDDRRPRLPGHPGAGQHPPPPLPEPHPRLRARADRRPLRLAGHPLPAVGPAGRGGGLRQRLRRTDGAGAERLHHLDRPPLRAPPRRGRPHLRRGGRGPGPGHAVPPHPRLYVAVGQGRRPAPGLGRAGRRRDPGRLRAAGGRPPRPVAAGHDPHRARPLLAVQRLHRPDGPHRRAGRAARRPAAHPPVRDPGRGRLLPGDLRPAPGRLPRRRGLDDRPDVARARGLALAGRGDPAGGRPRGGGALPVVEHDPGQRAVAGCRAAVRGRRRRAGGRRLRVGGLGVAVAGGADGDAAGQAAARRGRHVGARRPGDGHPRGRGLPGPDRRDRRAVGRGVRRPGRVVAGGPALRRCAVGPGGGVAALWSGLRPAHRRRRAAGRRGRRSLARRPGRAARGPPPGVRRDAAGAI
ncbi:MAG: Guanine deaminase, partial [uncultured Blastococcus sp.]